MIIHCPDCGYLMSTNIGCTNCQSQEVTPTKKLNSRNGKVEEAPGAVIPASGVQLKLIMQ